MSRMFRKFHSMEIFTVDVPTVIKSEYHLFPGKFSREWNLGTFPKRNSGSGQNCSSMTWSDLNAQPPRPPHALEMSQSELYGSDMLTVGFSRCWTIIGIIPLILWFLLSSLETATTFKILLRIKMRQKAAGLRLCLPFWKIKSYPKSSLSHKSNFFQGREAPELPRSSTGAGDSFDLPERRRKTGSDSERHEGGGNDSRRRDERADSRRRQRGEDEARRHEEIDLIDDISFKHHQVIAENLCRCVASL